MQLQHDDQAFEPDRADQGPQAMGGYDYDLHFDDEDESEEEESEEDDEEQLEAYDADGNELAIGEDELFGFSEEARE